MAISVGAVCVVVLVGGQLLAPPIATMLLRDRLAKDGRVLSVHVAAFPWLELLWQHADRVSVRMRDYQAAPDRLNDQLRQIGGVGTVEVSVGAVHTGLLALHDVSFSKRGDAVVAAAQLELRDLRAALPLMQSLTPVHEADGQLVLRGKASVLGLSATVDVIVAARDGRLVVAPAGLLGSFATLTIYDDPLIHVQSVNASAVAGGVRFVVRGQVR